MDFRFRKYASGGGIVFRVDVYSKIWPSFTISSAEHSTVSQIQPIEMTVDLPSPVFATRVHVNSCF